VDEGDVGSSGRRVSGGKKDAVDGCVARSRREMRNGGRRGRRDDSMTRGTAQVGEMLVNVLPMVVQLVLQVSGRL